MSTWYENETIQSQGEEEDEERFFSCSFDVNDYGKMGLHLNLFKEMSQEFELTNWEREQRAEGK